MTRQNWHPSIIRSRETDPQLNLLFVPWVTTVLLLICGLATTAAAVDDPLGPLYEIESFESRISLQDNAEIWVEENIVVNFKRPSEGCFRQLSVYSRDSSGSVSRAIIDQIEAHDADGNKLRISLNRTSSDTKVKIGNLASNSAGRHAYQLRYRLQNAIGFEAGYSELDLDITGIAWRAPIDRVRAVVEFRTSAMPTDLVAECATGSLGYRTFDCRSDVYADSVVISSSRALREFEGMTVRVRWGNEIVVRPSAWKRLVWKYELDSNWLWLVSVAPLILLYVRTSRIRSQFESRQGNAPVTQPQTFDGRRLSPAEAGLIFAERFDTRDVAATLFDLAARGALEIKVSGAKTNLALKFRQRHLAGEALSPLERRILACLKLPDAVGDSEVSTPAESLRREMPGLRKLVEDSLIARGYLISSPSRARLLCGLFAVALGGLVVALGFFLTNLNWALVLVAALIPAISIAGFGMKLTNKTARGIEAFHSINRFRAHLADSYRRDSLDVPVGDIGSQIGYVIALDAASEWSRVPGHHPCLKIEGLLVGDQEAPTPAAVNDLINWCIARLEGATRDDFGRQYETWFSREQNG